MGVHSFPELLQHVGHHVEVVTYGNPSVNASIECADCDEVLVDFHAPRPPTQELLDTGKEPIFRTVFQVEVFSRGSLNLAARDDDPFNLKGINYEICEGECIGMVKETSSEQVPALDLESHLLRIGNDGHFFDDPDEDWE